MNLSHVKQIALELGMSVMFGDNGEVYLDNTFLAITLTESQFYVVAHRGTKVINVKLSVIHGSDSLEIVTLTAMDLLEVPMEVYRFLSNYERSFDLVKSNLDDLRLRIKHPAE